MKDIYYVNSAGEKLNLLEPPYMLQTGELFDYKWSYTNSSTSMNGGRIDEFYKEMEERPLTLSVINYGKESYYAAIDKFFETTEHDVVNKEAGRLYFGDQYLNCYLIASKKIEWESDSSYLDNTVTLAIEYPYWIREKKYSFYKAGSSNAEGEIWLEYPISYPYEYTSHTNLQYLENDHFTASGFQMVFYGPVINPYVRIGGHLYEVETILYEGEYLVIDSRTLTVKKVLNYGTVENLFNSRNKESMIWEKIPPGKVPVTWPGTFGVDIILFQERGEPRWNS